MSHLDVASVKEIDEFGVVRLHPQHYSQRHDLRYQAHGSYGEVRKTCGVGYRSKQHLHLAERDADGGVRRQITCSAHQIA